MLQLQRSFLLHNEIVLAAARRADVPPSSVLIRWAQLRGVVPIIKAADAAHLEENLAASAVDLSAQGSTECRNNAEK